jgi:hypothetical protein
VEQALAAALAITMSRESIVEPNAGACSLGAVDHLSMAPGSLAPAGWAPASGAAADGVSDQNLNESVDSFFAALAGRPRTSVVGDKWRVRT